MIDALLGAKVIAPIAKEASPSLIGVQVRPASRVSQMPPWAAPTSQWLLSVGSTAIAAIRPLTGCEGLTCPSRMGAGPILVHSVAVRAVIEALEVIEVAELVSADVEVAAAISARARTRAFLGMEERG